MSSPRQHRGHGYPDLKPLLDRYLAEVRDRLGSRLSAVALYGSVARGQGHAASDIDLFVVHRGARASVFEVFLEVALQLRDHPLTGELRAKEIPTEPFPVLRSEVELADTPWLLLDICDHGIILFDPRAVLAHKLARLRLARAWLAPGRTRRRLVVLGSEARSAPGRGLYPVAAERLPWTMGSAAAS